MPYIGNPIYQSAFVTDQFSGDGTTTAFTMSVAPAGVTNVLVAVSGVLQDPSTYGVVGNTITFSAAPPSGTGNISCRYLGVPASGITTTAYRTVTEFTATASQTTFTPPSYNVGFINVYLNGVLLGSADYTATNGTTVVLAVGASAGNLVTVESFLISSVANAIANAAGSVSNSNLATDSVTTTKILDSAVTTAKIADNSITTAKIAAGAVVAADLATGAAVSNIGYTPANAANITTSTINSVPISNIDFNTSTFTNVNTTYYKWDLPAAGNYLLFMTVRARLWGSNGFGKIRLYNNTAGAVITNSDVMLIESGNNANLLNMCCSNIWPFTATGATTIYLQGYATAGSIGIQSDGNGYNNFTWLRIS